MTVRLSRQALADLRRIILESELRWGEAVARRTRDRLRHRFETIAMGHGHGLKRRDVPAELPFLFVSEAPFVIAYDQQTLQIVRILHGRRDLPHLFSPRSDESR